jgi:ferredoxin
MRLQVDYDRCTGLGVCEAIAPDVFSIEDDGTMRIVESCPADQMRNMLEEAVSGCPTEAISIVE